MRDSVVSLLEKTMETISIVVALTLGFAVANALEQIAAGAWSRHTPAPAFPVLRTGPEDPSHSQFDGIPRTRTDRRDLQLAMGQGFTDPDMNESIWPRKSTL